MKQILKNRIFISVMCLLIAGIIAFIAIPSMYKQKVATIQILVPNTEIKKGTQIAGTMLSTVEVGAYGLPSDLITDKALIVGKYTAVDISKNDYLMAQKFKDFLFDDTLDNIIKDGKMLVTVTLPTVASGLSSHLEKGDTVTVSNFIPEKERITPDGMLVEPSKVVMYSELKEVVIYDIENAQTESTADVRQNSDKNGTGYDPIPKTVTLIVDEVQAEKLIEAEYNGKIHLIFVERTVK